ncbi:DUF1877 family protein [Streptomyces sp. NPDC056264]|uniref:DUF1877 family protein n=1 Tax=Streptomyces sp. NPDC056264 TaxID=3345767 RepID=UPI003AAD709D
MGMSVTMWRLSDVEFSRGLDYIERRFQAAQQEEHWGDASSFSAFCEVGEVWDLINLAICGERIPTQGVESLVILGGDTLGEVGEPSGVITALTRQEVTQVSRFLDGIDIPSRITACEQIENLPDFVISEVHQRLRDIQSHYALATQEGQFVVTRVYGP